MIIVVNKKICQKKFCLIQFSFIWLIILVCNFKRPYKSNENKSTNQKHLIQFACDLQRCFSNWIKLGYKFLLICRWLLVSSLQRCLSLLIELLFSGTLRYTPAVRHTGTRQPARGDYISIHMLTLCSFNQISLQGWSMLLHSWFVWQIRIIFHIIEQCFIHDKNPTALRLIFGYQFSLFMQIIRRGSRIRLFSLVDLIVFWQRLMYILFHPFFPIFFFFWRLILYRFISDRLKVTIGKTLSRWKVRHNKRKRWLLEVVIAMFDINQLKKNANLDAFKFVNKSNQEFL